MLTLQHTNMSLLQQERCGVRLVLMPNYLRFSLARMTKVKTRSFLPTFGWTRTVRFNRWLGLPVSHRSLKTGWWKRVVGSLSKGSEFSTLTVLQRYWMAIAPLMPRLGLNTSSGFILMITNTSFVGAPLVFKDHKTRSITLSYFWASKASAGHNPCAGLERRWWMELSWDFTECPARLILHW